ncbi:tetratricopeptide repeat protein [Roseivirga sp. BDSF3-8]|uniref:tetratricopeptide repeat protein n=1 Tax=Roseivirga sp. BDSF3-8 TaxID=3241598 RepID=UPI0035321623
MSIRPAIIFFTSLFLFASCTRDEPGTGSYHDVVAFELQYEAAKNAMSESPQEAVSLLKEARQTAITYNNDEGVAKTWYLEGYVNDLYNRPGDAYKAFLESELAYTALNDSLWIEKSLRYQAAILLRLPDTDRAMAVLDHAARYSKDEQSAYRRQYLTGVAAFSDSRYEEAAEVFHAVAVRCKENEDYDYLAQTRNYLGLIALKNKQYEEAADYFFKSANTNSNDPLRRVVAYNNLGLLQEHKQNLDSASYYYEQVLAMPVSTGGLAHHMVAAINLAQLHLSQDHYEEAAQVIEESLMLNRHLQDADQLETAYGILIQAYESLGNMPRAKKVWKKMELVKNERSDLLKKHNKLEVQLAEITIRQRNAENKEFLSQIIWLPYLQLVLTILVLLAGTLLTIQFFRQRKALRIFHAHFQSKDGANVRRRKPAVKKDMTSVPR